MMINDHRERRRHLRTPLVRDCRVGDRRMIGFAVGKTSDVSPGGALIQVERTRAYGAGDELDVGVSWDGGGVVSTESMMRAVVRRVTPIDYHTQAIAVEFRDAVKLAA